MSIVRIALLFIISPYVYAGGDITKLPEDIIKNIDNKLLRREAVNLYSTTKKLYFPFLVQYADAYYTCASHSKRNCQRSITGRPYTIDGIDSITVNGATSRPLFQPIIVTRCLKNKSISNCRNLVITHVSQKQMIDLMDAARENQRDIESPIYHSQQLRGMIIRDFGGSGGEVGAIKIPKTVTSVVLDCTPVDIQDAITFLDSNNHVERLALDSSLIMQPGQNAGVWYDAIKKYKVVTNRRNPSLTIPRPSFNLMHEVDYKALNNDKEMSLIL